MIGKYKTITITNYIVFSDEHVNPAYNIKMCLKPLKE